MFETMPCSNTAAEKAHDRRTINATARHSAAMDQARREFHNGDLTDEIRDLAADHPHDFVAITLHVLFPEKFHEPRCSIKDARATIEGVLERRAALLDQE